MAIRVMDMATIRMGIIGRTRTIMEGLHSIGPEAIDITATVVTTTTAGIKDDVGLNPMSWLFIRASSFFFVRTASNRPQLSILRR